MEGPVQEADNRVALVDAPPRAPSPPPKFNVFDFMIPAGDTPTNSTHPLESPPSSPSSSEASTDSSSDEDEESDPDSMDTDENDPVVDAAEAAREYMKQELLKQGYTFGGAEQVRYEHFQSYAQFPPSPAGQSGQYETPAPKPHHNRNISTTSVDSTTKESTKKRKRGHPEELDLSSARAYKANGDVVMTDVTAPLHSGLTGGLNRLLSRPELPPSPPDVDSPQSPLKRSKQARIEDRQTKDKDKKRAEKLKEKEAKKSKSKEEKKKDKKDKKNVSSSVAVKDLKNGQWVRRRSRKDSSMQQTDQPASDQDATPTARKQLAIEYKPDGDDKLRPTSNNAVVLHNKKSIARAEVFLSASEKDLDSERGCSLNKALKRYYRDNGQRKNARDEKELFKTLRMRRNDRGELVLFIDGFQ
ncbi:hypothetical protein, variant [Verruconis gallopava]|nr:hypothetical protein, variant [Verruconis gallopava]KIW01767.1 hypothetical protein, variant [Verruconis gallopava]